MGIFASGSKVLPWTPFITELCLWMEDQKVSCCLSVGLMLLTDYSWQALHCRGCLSVGFRVRARRHLGTTYGGGGGGCLWISGRKMPSLSPRSLPPKEETCPELSLPWAVTSSGLTPWPLLLAGSHFTGDFSLFVPVHIAHLPIDMTSYLLKHSYVCFLGFLWPPAMGHPLALPL